MIKSIWLIGGTSESREITQILLRLSYTCIVTVTTPEAQFLYPPHPDLTVIIGRLKGQALTDFIPKYAICGIIDASHPYAVTISQQAIQLANRYQIPYLRYERPENSQGNSIIVKSFDALFSTSYLLGKRVLLTVGYQSLSLFESWHSKATLYARILPKLESLKGALAAGFSPERLIAFRPPLNLEMERALWKHWQIECVVSKASGKVGGETLKQQVANLLNIPLIIIDRPILNYPQQTNNLEDIILFCQQLELI